MIITKGKKIDVMLNNEKIMNGNFVYQDSYYIGIEKNNQIFHIVRSNIMAICESLEPIEKPKEERKQNNIPTTNSMMQDRARQIAYMKEQEAKKEREALRERFDPNTTEHLPNYYGSPFLRK